MPNQGRSAHAPSSVSELRSSSEGLAGSTHQKKKGLLPRKNARHADKVYPNKEAPAWQQAFMPVPFLTRYCLAPRRGRTGRRTPGDLPAVVRQIKAALRARIAASGRHRRGGLRRRRGGYKRRPERVEGDYCRAGPGRGSTGPVIDYADIEAGTVTEAGGCAASALAAWSCAVTSDREQALRRDREHRPRR